MSLSSEPHLSSWMGLTPISLELSWTENRVLERCRGLKFTCFTGASGQKDDCLPASGWRERMSMALPFLPAAPSSLSLHSKVIPCCHSNEIRLFMCLFMFIQTLYKHQKSGNQFSGHGGPGRDQQNLTTCRNFLVVSSSWNICCEVLLLQFYSLLALSLCQLYSIFIG